MVCMIALADSLCQLENQLTPEFLECKLEARNFGKHSSPIEERGKWRS